MLTRTVRVALVAVFGSLAMLTSGPIIAGAAETATPIKTTTTAPTATASGNLVTIGGTATTGFRQANQTKQSEQATANSDRQAVPKAFVPLQVGATIDYYCSTTTTTTQAYIDCVKSMALTSPTPPTIPTADDAQFAVTQLLVELEIPDPVINLGPDPSVNEWNAAVIGYPLWLWTSESDTRTLSTSFAGSPVTMRARRASVRFDMGDGSAPIACTASDAYVQGVVPVMQPAPRCGYTFTNRNEAGINYTVTARAHWIVEWSALGYNGTLTLNTSALRGVHVIELQSVVVAGK